MSLFDNIAMPLAQTEKEAPTPDTFENCAGGLTIYVKFKPQQKVWTFTEGGITCRTVIKVMTEHRSIFDGRSDHLDHKVTYLLDDSSSRTEDQLFDEETANKIMALIGK